MEAAVPGQDLVWAAAFPEVAAEELERAAPAEAARARADRAAEVAARAAPEAARMLEICGARRGREAVAAVAQAQAPVAQAREPVEALAVAQAAPEVVVAALAVSEVAASEEEAAQEDLARERARQVAAPVVEVAPEVAAGVAHLEALPEPAAIRANG